MKDRPKFRLAHEESKDVRATLPQAYYILIVQYMHNTMLFMYDV